MRNYWIICEDIEGGVNTRLMAATADTLFNRLEQIEGVLGWGLMEDVNDETPDLDVIVDERRL